MKKLILAFAACAALMSPLPVQAQSWGRGGAYAGADPNQGYRYRGNDEFRLKEPCWSAALSKCGREKGRTQKRGAQINPSR
jgi:hypothetical protein